MAVSRTESIVRLVTMAFAVFYGKLGAWGSHCCGLEGNEPRSRFPGRREELAARAFGQHSACVTLDSKPQRVAVTNNCMYKIHVSPLLVEYSGLSQALNSGTEWMPLGNHGRLSTMQCCLGKRKSGLPFSSSATVRFLN